MDGGQIRGSSLSCFNLPSLYPSIRSPSTLFIRLSSLPLLYLFCLLKPSSIFRHLLIYSSLELLLFYTILS